MGPDKRKKRKRDKNLRRVRDACRSKEWRKGGGDRKDKNVRGEGKEKKREKEAEK